MLVLDFDPGPEVDWPMLAAGARLARDILSSVGLRSFVKTTGGKGVHVVAPVRPELDWAATNDFAKAVAQMVEQTDPGRYTANMSKAKRTGRIFVDYVRNNRGATSVAPYSSRARKGATVAVPLAWEELETAERPRAYTIKDLGSRLTELKRDPWEDYFAVLERQSLAEVMKKAASAGLASRS
jgi:bifunctional non-homologous end joining protein LigD